MKKAKSRILAVDDHPLTRSGLCAAINEQSDLEVCGEAEGWREALRMVRGLRPDCLVLDLNLKDGSGWSLLEQLQAAGQTPPTLVLSMYSEEVYAQRLLQDGASGYLMKDEPIPRILDAIRKVLAGHIALSDSMASRLIKASVRSPESTSPADDARGQLSDRELQVFEMLIQGLGNKEIADRLGLSQKTIGTYKARLMRKFGVRTSPELTEAARFLSRIPAAPEALFSPAPLPTHPPASSSP